MATLIVKSWKVQYEAFEPNNSYVLITARAPGILTWILSLVGIDATTTIQATNEKVVFTSSSLSGTDHRVIPLQSICSSYYGYHKPWKKSVFIFGICFITGLMISNHLFLANISYETSPTVGHFVILIGLIIASIIYFLNRSLTLGFVENSGVINGIRFKRSVIENQDINQERAHAVCDLLQALIEMKHKQLLSVGS